MLQPGDKKALAIIGAVVVAALVIIAGATALLVRGHEKPLPTVALTAEDGLAQVEPSFWCSEKLTDCRNLQLNADGTPVIRTVDHPVRIGDETWVSVPEEISSSPWALLAEFATPRGLERVQWIHLPDEKSTQVLKSTPDRVLIGIEVSVVSAVQLPAPGQKEATDEGDFPFRGVFSVRTLPVGFDIPNKTPLDGTQGD
ncbi:DUF2771 family protein [Gordonia phthalatica]|uniref:DUF2771 domain-containing protein n=1 Tax=Gordonia phthalatica TaxID=1136941 RepID=A0A0N9NDZ8_9ACTN|nr:DUF2771 family protein [Gordonia phthalatica]ALG83798.1 hypothetical protein ACH46_03855 [Gordonia phthalatica]